MSSRKFFVLGTASQVPTRYRNHNGYFLRWDADGILFDPGEGTQRQMTFAEIAASEITKICITHFHGDHCLGLAGIVQRLSLDKVEHEVEIYYPASGQKYFENLLNASVFHNLAQLRPRPVSEPGLIYRGPTFTLAAERLDHPTETFGYRLQELDTVTMLPEKLAALGVTGPAVGRLKSRGSLEVGGRVISVTEVSQPKRGQSFAFVMDTRLCDAARRLAQDADLLVCESTFLSSEAEEAASYGHLTAAQAALIAKRANAARLVLTHYSRRYQSTEEFRREASQIFPNVVAADDGAMLEIGRVKI